MSKLRNEIEALVRPACFQYAAAYTATNLVEYEGWTWPGQATSDSEWMICKHTYDSNGNLTNTKWAGGSEFSQVWDDKDSLTYS